MKFDESQPAYRDLREAWKERTSDIVVWTGAGLSAASGVPLWGQLRQALLDEGERHLARVTDDTATKKARALLEVARNETDLWRSFRHLEAAVGSTFYETEIRRNLTPKKESEIPEAYKLIWKLRPRGLVDLNLDGLSVRAFAEVLGGERLSSFEGREVASRIHLLRDAPAWIAALHGNLDSRPTWAFNNEELDSLFAVPGYQEFVTTCLTAFTNVFIGISADDVAIGGHLMRLRSRGILPGHHYWITSRNDGITREWAESAGLRPIYYKAEGHDHSGLVEVLRTLQRYIPDERAPDPILPDATLAADDSASLPDPKALQAMEPEDIRKILNAEARRILTRKGSASEYDAFMSKYSRAIALAWNIELNGIDDKLFGYTIEKQLGEGAFARVFLARSADGQQVALKVLHELVRRDPTMFAAFRRGVASMRILASRKVAGMVPYREATEIPAMVVMDYVDGPNLSDVVEAKQIESWESVLSIAADLVEIVMRGHRLPERVLHRDIRPSNIMLERFWSGQALDVRVLDFDLSWHRDARDESVALPSAKFGYLAPEQLSKISGVSTRSALVDSFGIGMTLRYLITGREPAPGEQQRPDWPERVTAGIRERNLPTQLRCLPNRFARLVTRCTQHEQSSRLDLSQVKSELMLLASALSDVGKSVSAGIVSEEIAARSRNLSDKYEVSADSGAATASFMRGPQVVLQPLDDKGRVELRLAWLGRGDDQRSMLRSKLTTRVEQALAALRKGGWGALKKDVGIGTCLVSADILLPLEGRLRALVEAVDDAIESLSFD